MEVKWFAALYPPKLYCHNPLLLAVPPAVHGELGPSGRSVAVPAALVEPPIELANAYQLLMDAPAPGLPLKPPLAMLKEFGAIGSCSDNVMAPAELVVS